jgi:hypothetical protein
MSDDDDSNSSPSNKLVTNLSKFKSIENKIHNKENFNKKEIHFRRL